MRRLFEWLKVNREFMAILAFGAAGAVIALGCCCGGPVLIIAGVSSRYPAARPIASAPSRIEQSNEARRVHLGDVPTIEPQPLPADAQRLLVAMAAAPRGELIQIETHSGLTLHFGTEKLCKADDGPRAAAHWRELLRELEAQGIIELVRAGNILGAPPDIGTAETHRLTAAGYKLADKLSNHK
jgi:hypothetical protein